MFFKAQIFNFLSQARFKQSQHSIIVASQQPPILAFLGYNTHPSCEVITSMRSQS